MAAIIPLIWREHARETHRPVLFYSAPELHPQCNAYGHEPVEPVVDLDGNRVLIHGRHVATFNSDSNAIRSAAMLQELAALGWDLTRIDHHCRITGREVS